MRAGTLSLRLFLLNAAWALVAVAIIAVVLTEAYRRNAERRFAELVTANLYSLMGSVEPGEGGRLGGRPDLGDPRYLTFGTGWYWSVTSLSDPANRLASPSLGDGEIAPPAGLEFDPNFQRQFTYLDGQGRELAAIEAQVILGEGDEAYSFKVTGDRGELEGEISAFRRTLVALLALFALGFVLASFVIVRIGLAPISGATRRLADIRDGRAERLEGRFPAEIQPLIDEMNGLIESNRAIVDRARTQVGNLAHSLKTPIAVLRNEAASAPAAVKRVMLDQTETMQIQVQNYLDRARIAARHRVVTSRSPAAPVADRLVRVMRKLNPALHIEWDAKSDDEPVFAGEQQDLEEIVGNLLENASRHARGRVRVAMQRFAEEGQSRLRILIEDDGPGMTPQQATQALKRGERLDESTPGSGLGLAIVQDIVSEYQGAFVLGRSDLGGLKAEILLPAR
jgi:signal transduction histidine kinase